MIQTITLKGNHYVNKVSLYVDVDSSDIWDILGCSEFDCPYVDYVRVQSDIDNSDLYWIPNASYNTIDYIPPNSCI